MDGYFATSHAHNSFGVTGAAAGASRRRLIEGTHVAFPLRASAGRAIAAATAPAGRASALGRKGGF